jgi:hypothetical protein
MASLYLSILMAVTLACLVSGEIWLTGSDLSIAEGDWGRRLSKRSLIFDSK